MGPLDRIPEAGLSTELKRRKADANELKGSFQTFGASSVVTHRIFSENIYDLEFTASSTPDTRILHRADVEFIPDDLTFGGAFCHRVYARYLDTSNTELNFHAPMFERRVSRDGAQKWSFYHYTFGYPSDSLRLKFYFFTTGSGTFTTTIVN